MSPKETVKALYAAYGAGDARRIEALLHPEVLWVAPAGNATQVALGLASPDDAGQPAGSSTLDRQRIVAFMAGNFARLFRDASNAFLTLVADQSTVVAEHRLSATLPNGRRYLNDYCFLYEVRDGQVHRIREYMDTRGGWRQVFGDDHPGPLLPFVDVAMAGPPVTPPVTPSATVPSGMPSDGVA